MIELSRSCPKCGGLSFSIAGTCSFRFIRGEWRMKRGTSMISCESGELARCDDCLAELEWDDSNFTLLVQLPTEVSQYGIPKDER